MAEGEQMLRACLSSLRNQSGCIWRKPVLAIPLGIGNAGACYPSSPPWTDRTCSRSRRTSWFVSSLAPSTLPSSSDLNIFSLLHLTVAKLSQIPSISKQLPCALPNQYEALGPLKEKLQGVVPLQEEQHVPVEIVVGAAYM